MTSTTAPLPSFLVEPSRIAEEISVTGRWVPTKPGFLFWSSAESTEMRREWQDIHADAKADPGVLSTQLHHAVGDDAVLVHHVFRDADALVNYFETTATRHVGALMKVAKPELHLVRGTNVPEVVRQALAAKHVDAAVGDYIFGYVLDDYRRPDPNKSIQVTAKWSVKPGVEGGLDALKYWWGRVAEDAREIEPGLVRFEAYEVAGEDALIIHETFSEVDALYFHLTKGTAERYKKDLDKISAPEGYFFRGPVSWTIRAYSKVLSLPATYTSLVSEFTSPGGSMSEGLTA